MVQTQTDAARVVTIRWLYVASRLPLCTSTTGEDAPSGTGIFMRFRCLRSTCAEHGNVEDRCHGNVAATELT